MPSVTVPGMTVPGITGGTQAHVSLHAEEGVHCMPAVRTRKVVRQMKLVGLDGVPHDRALLAARFPMALTDTSNGTG